MQNRVFVKGYDAVCALGVGMDDIFENLLDKRCKITQDTDLTVGDETLYTWRTADADNALESVSATCLQEIKATDTALLFVNNAPKIDFKSSKQFQTSTKAILSAIEEIKSGKSTYVLVCASFSYDKKRNLELFNEGKYSHAVARPFDIDADGMNSSDAICAILLGTEGAFELCAANEASSMQDAIVRALESSATDVGDIDLIEAAATGVSSEDAVEAKIIGEIFGQEPFVASSKGFCGHSFEASALLSVCMALIAMEEDIVPASSFLEHAFTNEVNFSYANRVKTLEKILINSNEISDEYASIILGKTV